MTEVEQFVKDTIANNDVALFMKGTAKMPMCGFSATVVNIFNKLGLTFQDVNIYSQPGIPQALRDINQWPTYPQIFIKGEFIGGCDITREMFEAGELQELLKEKNIAFAA